MAQDQGDTRPARPTSIAPTLPGFTARSANVQTVMVSYSSFTDTATGRVG